MGKKFNAHVRKNEDGTWALAHTLSDHLMGTSHLAEMFAGKFESGTWGKGTGLAHDVGKGRVVWQSYFQQRSGCYGEDAHQEGKKGIMPHAIHGAELVESLYGKGVGRPLAYCIAGHHAGLPDWSSAENSGRSSLRYQKEQVKDLSDIHSSFIDKVEMAKPTPPPWKFAQGLDMSLWIRMLYSCLVDADFLDTERYMELDKAQFRGGYCSINELLRRFNVFIRKLDEESEDTRVNEIRREIRAKCVEMSREKQGVFSLFVPTGGGKTLSSLAFALEHAKLYDLERIIYVIPYTSIIEQNADVFRSAIGEDQVVEHHSSIDETNVSTRSRLAAENWDAPVIVTTSVQFFESLFAAKSSRCRKLHNIVKSVVILDEAQLVPVEFLEPILETMQLLVDHYHVSLVISTATQPAFNERMVDGHLFNGLRNTKEIMGGPEEVKLLYQALVRNRVQFPDNLNDAPSWGEMSAELKLHDQVLCIVSDRRSCRELHKLMPEGAYHLSALMCGQHRSEIIDEIKKKLKEGEPVQVVSTQLVEAGVDFDFPVVYRAFAGLDSIAQAAGRCNREGKLTEGGRVVVFNSPRTPPIGLLRKAADTTRSVVSGSKTPMDFSMFEKYFAELYWKANSLDKEGIVDMLDPRFNDPKECSIYFRTAATKFKIIDDSMQKTVFVRYGEGEKLINLLKVNGPDRWLMRKLQRYTVNVYTYQFNELIHQGAVEEIYPEIFALSSNLYYSKDIGLLVNESNFDAEYFIV